MYRGYSTNNIYEDSPPLMKDGRTITASYEPYAVVTEKIIRDANITSNWEYRNFMTRNANKIRNYNYKYALTDSGYVSRPIDLLDGGCGGEAAAMGGFAKPYDINKSVPMLFNSIMDNRRVSEDVFSRDSDLKQSYLSREQLNARKIAPVVTQQQLFEVIGAQNAINLPTN